MSTLKETLIHRRVEKSAAESGCHSAMDFVPALLIHAESNERWVLPWAHFVSARHQVDADREHLTLLFARHEVEVYGVRLASLLPVIAKFHLDSLRSVPAKYESLGDSDAPFIERVSVAPIGTPPDEETASSC
jgi:hypothetical protein